MSNRNGKSGREQCPRRSAAAQSGIKEYLYEPAFGLPVVRRKVEYGELLREIRENKVREIAYFDSNPAPKEKGPPSAQTNLQLEGFCLVVYNDDKVAQVTYFLFVFQPNPRASHRLHETIYQQHTDCLQTSIWQLHFCHRLFFPLKAA